MLNQRSFLHILKRIHELPFTSLIRHPTCHTSFLDGKLLASLDFAYVDHETLLDVFADGGEIGFGEVNESDIVNGAGTGAAAVGVGVGIWELEGEDWV